MRRFLVAAVVLLVIGTTCVAWKLLTNDSGASAAGRIAETAPIHHSPADPVPRMGHPPNRGHRTAALPVPSPPVANAREETATGIQILVLDSKGDPMPGIDLYAGGIQEEFHFSLEGTTDRNGMFPTDIADANQIEVIGLDVESERLDAEGPFESTPERPRVVVVRVPRSVHVTGTVHDEEGRPIPGALVQVVPQPVLGLDPFVAILRPLQRGTSADTDGRFALAIPESCVAITAHADGFDASEVALVCLSADAPNSVDLLLQGGSREILVEVRAQGVPLERRVLVTALREEDSKSEARAPGDPIVRDPDSITRGGTELGSSTYSVKISRDGDWIIDVSHAEGFAGARVPVGPNDERIVVNLQPPAPLPDHVPLRGRVSTKDGTPLAADVMVLYGPDFDGGSAGQSDAAGNFVVQVSSAHEERVLILARARGFGTRGIGPIEFIRLPDSVDIVLPTEKTISGVVLDPDGLPVAAEASIRPSKANFAPSTTAKAQPAEGFFDAGLGLLGFERAGYSEPRQQGAFSFRGLSDGWYQIWVVADDYERRLPPAYVVAQAGEQDLRITLGSGLEELVSLEGVISESGTGRPVPGAGVSAGPADRGIWGHAYSLSGEDGNYALQGCPRDLLSLEVHAPGHAIFEAEIGPLAPGTHRMDIAVHPSRVLRLLVLDPTGRPRPGIVVSAADSSGKPISLLNRHGGGEDCVATDLAGRIDLRGLPPAQVRAIVGVRPEGASYCSGEAYRAPIESQPAPVEAKFDLRVPVEGVQRLVIPR